MRRILLILLLAITQISAAPAPPSNAEQVHTVPLVAVIANPERYHGKVVRVMGFLVLEYEDDALYLSKSDFDQLFTTNAVWVNGPKDTEPAARRALSGKHVFLTGRFDADHRGHLGLFSGALVDVSEIGLTATREQYAAALPSFHPRLPWPIIILVLLTSMIVLAGALKLWPRGASSLSRRWLVECAFILVGAVAVFSIARLWDFPDLRNSAWRPDPMMMSLLAVEFGVGVSGMVASAFFAARRRVMLCVLFAAIQLIMPAILELRAFAVLDAPLSLNSARLSDYRWEASLSSTAESGAP